MTSNGKKDVLETLEWLLSKVPSKDLETAYNRTMNAINTIEKWN